MSAKDWAVFDVCGSLFDSNTTYDFLEYYLKKYNRKKYRKWKFCSSLPAKVLWKGAGFIGQSQKVRKLLLSFFKGESTDAIQSEAAVFAQLLLKEKKISASHKKLKKIISEDNYNVLLISASVEPVIKAIAGELGDLKFRASHLEEKNGMYTGYLLSDLEGRKAEQMKKEGLLNEREIRFCCTDSFADSDLVAISKEALIICSKKKAELWKEKFEGKLKLEFSEHD